MRLNRTLAVFLLLALFTTHATHARAADSTVWPPSGSKFPPPKSVPVWSYYGDGGDSNSYTFDGARLLAPFHKTVTAKNSTVCFHTCADYEPKDLLVERDHCNSWTYNKKTKECSLSGGTGCNEYTIDPAACVKWYKKKDSNYISGWVAVPLQ